MYFWQLVAPRGDRAMRVLGLYFYIPTMAGAALCPSGEYRDTITFIALGRCSYGAIFVAREGRTISLAFSRVASRFRGSAN